MQNRKQMIKTLKDSAKGWEKTYLTKDMIENIVFLLEDRDKKEKQPKPNLSIVKEERE